MNRFSLSELFYQISGVKPKLSDMVTGALPSHLDAAHIPEVARTLSPDLAELRARQFLSREHLTRSHLQLDPHIPTFRRYQGPEQFAVRIQCSPRPVDPRLVELRSRQYLRRQFSLSDTPKLNSPFPVYKWYQELDQPAARDDYQECIWNELLLARYADGWGNRNAKLIAEQVSRYTLCDHSLFGIRARLFVEMVKICSGEHARPGTPERLREQARHITNAFFAQKDDLSAAVGLQLEALLAYQHWLATGEQQHLVVTVDATRGVADLLIGRARHYPQRLIQIALFTASTVGIVAALKMENRKLAQRHLHLLEESAQAITTHPTTDWIQLSLLKSRTNYFLLTRDYEACAEGLYKGALLYDRLDQNLPFLGWLTLICGWSKEVQPTFPLTEALSTYVRLWQRNPRLGHLNTLAWLLGRPAPLIGRLRKSSPPEFGARIALLSREDGLLRL